MNDKKAAEELSKGILNGAKDASELLKNGIIQAISNTTKDQSDAKTQSDMATIKATENLSGMDFAEFQSGMAVDGVVKSTASLKNAEFLAKKKASEGDYVFQDKNGNALEGFDALYAQTEAQSRDIKRVVSADGKSTNDYRVGANGNVDTAKIRDGVDVSAQDRMMGWVRDEFGDEGVDNVLTFMAGTAGIALGGTALKYGKNVFKAHQDILFKKPEINPATAGITRNTTMATVNPKGGIDIETPLHSDFDSMGGLNGTPKEPTFMQMCNKKF